MRLIEILYNGKFIFSFIYYDKVLLRSRYIDYISIFVCRILNVKIGQVLQKICTKISGEYYRIIRTFRKVLYMLKTLLYNLKVQFGKTILYRRSQNVKEIY